MRITTLLLLCISLLGTFRLAANVPQNPAYQPLPFAFVPDLDFQYYDRVSGNYFRLDIYRRVSADQINRITYYPWINHYMTGGKEITMSAAEYRALFTAAELAAKVDEQLLGIPLVYMEIDTDLVPGKRLAFAAETLFYHKLFLYSAETYSLANLSPELGKFYKFPCRYRKFLGVNSATRRTGELRNLSTRKLLGVNDHLIVGFVHDGPPKQFLLRGVGPSLGQFGITTLLSGTTITLYNSKGEVVASNSSWEADSAKILPSQTKVGAFPLINRNEGVLLVSLPTGAYTVKVNGQLPSESGEILAEIYQVD